MNLRSPIHSAPSLTHKELTRPRGICYPVKSYLEWCFAESRGSTSPQAVAVAWHQTGAGSAEGKEAPGRAQDWRDSFLPL